MKIFQGGVYIVNRVLSVNREKYMKLLEREARKKIEKAKRKRNQRKTLYPVGFEYRSERK